MSAKITVLGSGTCQLQKERMASSLLIELGDLKLVFDFGRGVAQRVTELGLKQDDIRNIYLSHFHIDHISDLLPYLHAARYSRTDPRKLDLHIYGPRGLKGMLMRLMSLPADDNFFTGEYDIHLHESAGKIVINRQEFEMAPLAPAGNHGLRFETGGKICALTGDSHFHEDLLGFLRGVDLAVIDSGHITDDEILQVAVQSQPRVLVCSHLYRELDEKTLGMTALGRGYRGKLVVARDLMTFEL